MRPVLKRFFAFCFLLFAFCFLPNTAFAQTTSTLNQTTKSTNSFTEPDLDPSVPRNQHIYTQSVMIEVLSAVVCQITGLDPVNPYQGCLGVNPQTRKLSLIPPSLDEKGSPQVGGLLGASANMIAVLYVPTTSSTDYFKHVAGNFGLVKSAQAQEDNSYGLIALQPVFGLWETVRNVSYTLLVLAFVFIGVGIMVRFKIDPRTVMNLQNQIPRVIITIILITFSYAISAVLIDMMWVSTYAGVRVLGDSSDTKINDCKSDKPESLSENATKNLLQTPLTYFHNVFGECDESDVNKYDGGFHRVTFGVAGNLGQVLNDTAKSLFQTDENREEGCFSFSGIKPNINPGACLISGITGVMSFMLIIVIFVILLITLFRIWFALLKAYIYTLVFVITAPVYYVLGLLPSRPLGFQKWLRSFFANIAVFPITAFVLVGARLMIDLYKNDLADKFVPPLVGTPVGANFGVLMAFGALLITPSLQQILKDKLGVKGIASPGLIAAGLAVGASPVSYLAGRMKGNLTRRDSHGNPIGSVSRGVEQIGKSAYAGTIGKLPGGVGKWATQRQKENYEMRAMGMGGKTTYKEFLKTTGMSGKEIDEGVGNIIRDKKYKDDDSGKARDKALRDMTHEKARNRHVDFGSHVQHGESGTGRTAPRRQTPPDNNNGEDSNTG